MTQVAMNSNDPCCGHIQSLLKVSSGAGEFIVAGYYARDGQRKYFWSHQRNGHGFQFMPIEPLPASEINKRLFVVIWKHTGSSWGIELDSDNGSYYWAGYSTSNSMNGNHITIGMTLWGTSGSSSPLVFYSFNRWFLSSGEEIFQLRPDPSPGDADFTSSYITEGWNTNSKPSQAPEGGTWIGSVP
jgi:hypothetical protein